MSFNPSYFFPTLITNITSLNGGVYGTVKSSDVYAAVDVTDLTQSPDGTTKPYQINQLLNFILTSIGLYTYQPVLAATTATLTATYNNGLSGVGATLTNSGTQAAFTLDGQSGVLNGRYLIKDETNAAYNGIYSLTTVGDTTTNWVLTRTIDFNSSTNILENGLVYVIYGTVNAQTMWQDTYTSPLTVGTTAINFAAYSTPILETIANNEVLSNISGAPAIATGNTLTAIIDSAISNTQGSILYRGATDWLALSPSTSGYFLQTQGTAANPVWAASPGSGTVNSGTQNDIGYYATTGSTISGLSTSNTSVLTTNSSGAPGFTSYVSTGGTYGGTSNMMARDSNGNTAINNSIDGQATSTGGSSIVLTAASSKTQIFSGGSGASNLTLPDATTLLLGHTFYVNNNTSSSITVKYNSGTTFITLPAGGYVQIILTVNSTSNGSWDAHWSLPLTGGISSGLIYMCNGLNSGYRFSTATYPFTTTINQLLYSSAANTISGLATANSSILATNGSGVPSWTTTLPFTIGPGSGGTGVSNPTAHTIPIAEGTSNFNFVGPLTNGQLLIGSTGADPVASTLTAGSNISISNSSGAITISATGIVSGAVTYSDIFLMMGA